MKLRFLTVHALDGPWMVLEVEALGDFRPTLLNFDKLKVGVIEAVRLPESLEIDYGAWQEFADDVHNRSHFRPALGNVFRHQRNLRVSQEYAVDILRDVMKDLDPNASRTGGRPAKEGIAGIKVMDWKNPPPPSRLRVSAERTAEIALAATARLREFLKRNPFPWISRR